MYPLSVLLLFWLYPIRPANSSTFIWLNNLQCYPGERCFSKCELCPDGFIASCSHQQDATIRCCEYRNQSIISLL